MNNRQPKFNEEELLAFAKSYLSEAFSNPDRIGCPPISELACMAEHRDAKTVDQRPPFPLFSVLQGIYGDPGLRETKERYRVRSQFLTAHLYKSSQLPKGLDHSTVLACLGMSKTLFDAIQNGTSRHKNSVRQLAGISLQQRRFV